ncbi:MULTISPECIES: replication initiation protein [unclassified Myroides]|uniref:replication initiation protein n=1 Tax=unclassified Myroides TaxID=2642485 RepID=UPI00310101F9
MKITDKEVLQSYILTTAKYDYSVYEKRILYRIIELNQYLMEGKQLNAKHAVNPTLYDSYQYIIPLSTFLTDEDKDKNHARIKKAFETLSQKIITYDDKANKQWRASGIVFNVKMDYSRADSVTFYVADFIYNALMDFSKGYRKYELVTAMSFQSEYSMRFYELFSNQAKPINYSIEELKEMFCITNKYKLTADFLRYVVEPAKKELDEKSPYTFIYKPLKTGRKITSLQFIPIYQAGKENQGLKAKKLGKQMSTRFYLEPTDKEYLMAQYGFTDKEIKNNCDLFEELYQVLDKGELIDKLADLRRFASETINPKGYVIKSLKILLNDVKIAKEEKKTKAEKVMKEKRTSESQSLADVLGSFQK